MQASLLLFINTGNVMLIINNAVMLIVINYAYMYTTTLHHISQMTLSRHTVE